MLKAGLLFLISSLQCMHAFVVPSVGVPSHSSALLRGHSLHARRSAFSSREDLISMNSGYRKKGENEFDLLGGKDFDLLSFRRFYREALLR
jgi:hypothetical protein